MLTLYVTKHVILQNALAYLTGLIHRMHTHAAIYHAIPRIQQTSSETSDTMQYVLHKILYWSYPHGLSSFIYHFN